MMNSIMRRRAKGLGQRLLGFLPAARPAHVLDIGSGTGHNAEYLRAQAGTDVMEVDLVDMSTGGLQPQALVNARQLPFVSEAFDAVLLIYVLHYANEPIEVLREAARVSRGPVLMIQTIFIGVAGRFLLHFNEFAFGRFAFVLARFFRLIAPSECPLHSRHCFSFADLVNIANQAGLTAEHVKTERILGVLPIARTICSLHPKSCAGASPGRF